MRVQWTSVVVDTPPPPLHEIVPPFMVVPPHISTSDHTEFVSVQAMAEGFAAVDYVTDVRLSEVKGKRLWLVRVPRHIDPARLEVRTKHHLNLQHQAFRV